jgi:nucleoside-diphosphate-sugar epimerase
MNKNMKVLVTGGAGFIGSNLIIRLLSKGYSVKIIDDLSTGSLENIRGLDIEFIKGSILDFNLINDACKDVDVIFHLAASVGRQKSIDFPINDSETNILGTINILEAMKLNHVRKIVYSSSAAIFGELKSNEIDEQHVQNPNCQYGVSKLAAEKMIIAYKDLYNISYVCLRYFNIYGEKQKFDLYGNVIPIFAQRIMENKSITIYGDGNQTRDFLHVHDVAEANILAAESNFEGVLNLGSGNSISINDLVARMINFSENIPDIIYKERRIGDVFHCKANIQQAINSINFHPSIDFNTGLFNYLSWFNNTFTVNKF